ncbi:nucleotide-diphospho-sugar transferase [Eremomyces bilateralis CBS 781.70]|uniref:Nucleotide-diphospho-sugar transferase n=1 Tax=Eremomyces bilateralis CBS 781.70 TaxID=1392243 RepID=A0A6G1FT52_9PEZI|nr:nucleotide-diphospho-sugar transferase [Eremomyces bilateralis CBS 781.70]KAF1808910.1 nucleotide-diphospho-sugar transferase [Eremomyces bilateralis CBS 781.70]
MSRQITKVVITLISTVSLLFLVTTLYLFNSKPLSAFGFPFSRGKPSHPKSNIRIYEPSTAHVLGQSVAYATFLSTRVSNDSEPDAYFTATRVLAYQLLHQPQTKSTRNIPLLVLVPPHVSDHKRSVLASEGATIVPISNLKPEKDWVGPTEPRWVDQFSKLQLWELDKYDRILYLDNDMLLTQSLDPIFTLPVASTVLNTLKKAEVKADEALLPSKYLMVGVSDTGGAEHPFPPEDRPGSSINGGFFLLRPDRKLFNYYLSVMEIEGRFDSGFMEQGLLNYAHRHDGNMPAKKFPPGEWNVNWPSLRDLEGGAASLHDKFWEEGNKKWIDRTLVEMWWRVQGQMEGFWQKERAPRRGRAE